MDKPIVSVCIPTYNGVEFLQETLDSVKRQTYNNIELIVSDDNSKDETLVLVEQFKKEVSFPVFIYHHKQKGIGANWNNCIKNTNGEYIKFIFQDDILLPTCIEEMVNIFEKFKNIGLVVSKRDFIIEESPITQETKNWIDGYGDLQFNLKLTSEDGISILDSRLFRSEEFLKSPLNKIGEPSTYLFQKKIFDEVDFFNEKLFQTLDYLFCYRILKKYSVVLINKPLVKFRLHKNQTTNKNKNKNIIDYQLYEKILFNEFYEFLHPKVQKHLFLKFSKINKLRNWAIKSVNYFKH